MISWAKADDNKMLDTILSKKEGVPALFGMASEFPTEPEYIEKQNNVKPLQSKKVMQLQTQVQVQKKRIAELGRTIASLNYQLSESKKQPSSEAMLKLENEINESRKVLAKTQTQLSDASLVIDKKSKTVESLEEQVAQLRESFDQNLQQGAEQAKTAQLKKIEMTELLKKKNDEIELLSKKLQDSEEILSNMKKIATSAKPESKESIRDYAIGASLAEDIIAMLEERQGEGIKINHDVAFSGLQDTLGRKQKLSSEVIKSALDDFEKLYQKNQSVMVSKSMESGEKYMKEFSKRKNVKKHPDGFLYIIDYLGDSEFQETDFITVSVKESLTNGKVINDMDIGGTYVSQPLNAYPGLFQKAIRLLKNHGSITMVVPPSLAYGDKGYPPEIPPGATMIYNLRIQGVDSP